MDHPGLTCIQALSSLTNLDEIILTATGVRQWPAQLAALTALTHLSITQDPAGRVSGWCCSDFDARFCRHLHLPAAFFNMGLLTLDLSFHSIRLPNPGALMGLQGLTELNLAGCELLTRTNGIWMPIREQSKQLQGLTGLLSLSLKTFAPFSRGMISMADHLHQLGVTNLAMLQSLDLSDNRLMDVPTELTALTALTHLNMSRNLILAQKCLGSSAVGHLSKLVSLNFADCMVACLASVILRLARMHFQAGSAKFNKTAHGTVCVHAHARCYSLTALTDLEKLLQSCPDLTMLQICNAA